MRISVKVQSLQFQVGLVGKYYAFDIGGQLDELSILMDCYSGTL